MTTIKIAGTDEIRTLEVFGGGDIDYLADVLGPFTVDPDDYDGNGVTICIDPDVDAEFVMSEDEYGWWEAWCEREERISDAIANADEDMLARHFEVVDEYGHDLEELQRHECELFGIEY